MKVHKIHNIKFIIVLFIFFQCLSSCKKVNKDSLKSDYQEKYKDSIFLSLSPKMSETDFKKYSDDEVKKNRLKKSDYFYEYSIKTPNDSILDFIVSNDNNTYIQLFYMSNKSYFSLEKKNEGFYSKIIDFKKVNEKIIPITKKVKSVFPSEEIENDYVSYKRNLDFIINLYKSKYKNELKVDFFKNLSQKDIVVNDFTKRGLESFGLNKNNLFLVDTDKLIVLSYNLDFIFRPNYDELESHIKHELNFDLKINYYFKDDFLKLRNEIKKDSLIYLKEVQKMKEKKKNDVEMKEKKLLDEI